MRACARMCARVRACARVCVCVREKAKYKPGFVPGTSAFQWWKNMMQFDTLCLIYISQNSALYQSGLAKCLRCAYKLVANFAIVLVANFEI